MNCAKNKTLPELHVARDLLIFSVFESFDPTDPIELLELDECERTSVAWALIFLFCFPIYDVLWSFEFDLTTHEQLTP